MKRSFAVMVKAGCAAAWTASAEEASGTHGSSAEAAKQRQSILKKHDKDGDGVLSKRYKKAVAETGGVGTAGKALLFPAVHPVLPHVCALSILPFPCHNLAV